MWVLQERAGMGLSWVLSNRTVQEDAETSVQKKWWSAARCPRAEENLKPTPRGVLPLGPRELQKQGPSRKPSLRQSSVCPFPSSKARFNVPSTGDTALSQGRKSPLLFQDMNLDLSDSNTFALIHRKTH